MKQHVSTTINGESVEFLCEPQQTLLDVLREELDLIGTKEGCGTGDCGACSVSVAGLQHSARLLQPQGESKPKRAYAQLTLTSSLRRA